VTKIISCLLVLLLLPAAAVAQPTDLYCSGTTYYYAKGIHQQPKLIEADSLPVRLDAAGKTMVTRLYDAVASLGYHEAGTEIISEMHFYNPRILNNKIIYEVVHLNPDSGDMVRYLVSDEPKLYPSFSGRCRTKNILY